MSKPSVRKQKKQKDRERRIAKKKHEAVERRIYARKFPAFEIQANNADAGFVNMIERSLRDIDFRDSTLFDPKETAFLKLVKREHDGHRGREGSDRQADVGRQKAVCVHLLLARPPL